MPLNPTWEVAVTAGSACGKPMPLLAVVGGPLLATTNAIGSSRGNRHHRSRWGRAPRAPPLLSHAEWEGAAAAIAHGMRRHHCCRSLIAGRDDQERTGEYEG
ncbi:hypothetical protein OsI_11985 [Oryza sativa Indica Group]|uniref:Uncharacterized protein n=1 Tax=Oryza sativa subsp. indica TaxID=39946 RepID=B8AJP8_ORYSI|nr:hypothetical protein OsI_11985 [Oryza sativa Indica Group]